MSISDNLRLLMDNYYPNCATVRCIDCALHINKEGVPECLWKVLSRGCGVGHQHGSEDITPIEFLELFKQVISSIRSGMIKDYCISDCKDCVANKITKELKLGHCELHVVEKALKEVMPNYGD